MLLTVQAALALAMQCVSPSIAPLMVGISQQESGLNPAAVHRNSNGTFDVGLAQVNSANFGWLGLTMQTAMDPCRNLAAGARVLLARYNGDPPPAIKAAYASAVTGRIRDLDSPEGVSAANNGPATPSPSHAQSAGLEDAPAEPETIHIGD